MNGSQHTVSDDPMMCTSHKPLHCTCGNVSRNELTYNFSGNTQPQSSQLAKPLWTYTSLKSGISVHELIFTKKKKKKAQTMNEQTNIFPKSLQARKKPPTSVSAKCAAILLLPSVELFFSASLRTNFNEKHSMGVIADNLISTLDKA